MVDLVVKQEILCLIITIFFDLFAVNRDTHFERMRKSTEAHFNEKVCMCRDRYMEDSHLYWMGIEHIVYEVTSMWEHSMHIIPNVEDLVCEFVRIRDINENVIDIIINRLRSISSGYSL